MANIALASSHHVAAAESLLSKINDAILFPLITLLMALALLLFLWGAFRFVANAASDDARTTGKQHMMYGIIGMLIMLSAYAILHIAAGTFGVEIPE